jgi:hypothetical protein
LRAVIRDGAEYVHDDIQKELVRCAREMVENHGGVGSVGRCHVCGGNSKGCGITCLLCLYDGHVVLLRLGE